MPLPSTDALKRARTAVWIVLLGSIIGLIFAPTDRDGFRLILLSVLMLDAIVLVILRSTIRSRTLPPAAERSLMFVLIVALAWGMIDAYFFGQGLISIILLICGVFHFLPRAIAVREDSGLFRLCLSKAVIVSIAGLAALGAIVYGNMVARERAETLVVAVEQFHAKHGRYPERLEEVVPVFIAEIPKAKYVLTAETFRYFSKDSSHWLMYVEVPPFGRRIYTFEDHKWTYLD